MIPAGALAVPAAPSFYLLTREHVGAHGVLTS
jgi:hypothetical protein